MLNKVNDKIQSELQGISNVSNKQYEKITKFISENSNGKSKISWSKIKTKQGKLDTIQKYMGECDVEQRTTILKMLDYNNAQLRIETVNMMNEIQLLKSSLKDIETTLDKSIYAHSSAKSQITKIISQWITGETSGYCFGFEGSPGVGKT